MLQRSSCQWETKLSQDNQENMFFRSYRSHVICSLSGLQTTREMGRLINNRANCPAGSTSITQHTHTLRAQTAQTPGVRARETRVSTGSSATEPSAPLWPTVLGFARKVNRREVNFVKLLQENLQPPSGAGTPKWCGVPFKIHFCSKRLMLSREIFSSQKMLASDLGIISKYLPGALKSYRRPLFNRAGKLIKTSQSWKSTFSLVWLKLIHFLSQELLIKAAIYPRWWCLLQHWKNKLQDFLTQCECLPNLQLCPAHDTHALPQVLPIDGEKKAAPLLTLPYGQIEISKLLFAPSAICVINGRREKLDGDSRGVLLPEMQLPCWQMDEVAACLHKEPTGHAEIPSQNNV